MNARLKSIVDGAKGDLKILVVDSVDAYHDFPIHKQVALTGFDTVYEPDGSPGFLAKYGNPVPGVIYLNFPIHFEDTYKQILDIMTSEFGEEIKNKGSVTVSWNNLLNAYLKNLKIENVTADALEADAEGVYAKARAEGKMISSRINNLEEDQVHINDLLKDSDLNLISTRSEDILVTYALDKFNPKITPSGKLVFVISESDLRPKKGGLYDVPEEHLAFN